MGEKGWAERTRLSRMPSISSASVSLSARIAQSLQQRCGGGGLGCSFRRRRGTCLVVSGHAHCNRELQCMVRAARPNNPVFGESQAATLRPFLQQRFRIARRPSHLREARTPPSLDKGESRVKSAVQI